MDRLEEGLWVAAMLVKSHGNKYSFLIDRMEKEIEKLKSDDPAARAEKILTRYKVKGSK